MIKKGDTITSIGGIVRLDKDIVDMSDGLFEIMLIKKIRTPADLNTALVSIMNSDFNNKMFDFIHAPAATFTSDQPMSWSLDGEEANADSSIRITNLHNAITLMK